ncbi:kinase-like protein [Calocera viscosa TUFC12733]|uniref:Serine/threonine-protein kinase n=1 Tax=Calocera viscosa (strain TUFC12733) TaxID=1330018 RepID=A0A167L6Z4_CALVF|nr:kinase-like protein [Calocera viscosa TUFC12733]
MSTSVLPPRMPTATAPLLPRHISKPRMAPLAPLAPLPPALLVKSSPPPPVPSKDLPHKDHAGPAAREKDKDGKEKERKHKLKPEFRDPPRLVIDKQGAQQYTVLSVLGQGGFARVYEARDGQGKALALKVINKGKLADTKAKTRLYAEIKIHRALNHPHVCAFGDCFEDDDNVYITLELCRAGSLMDFVRKRARLSEPEVRLYMVQLAGAISYLHTHQIIHRDLKLGNLFLDDRLELKVGDFGLAALLEREGERKTTICGTPNYIAPEVLFASKTHGHSYEVDIWSIGVIMFTMLTGKPPFQTDKVEDIYRRIRDSKYEFPATFDISPSAKNLVQRLLSQKPEDRPTPQNLLSHPFFTDGHVPAWMSQAARTSAPNYTPSEQLKAPANLKALRKRAQIDDVGGIRVRREGVLAASHNGASSAQQNAANAARAWEDGEREFEKAVNVGSPISALLRSAKLPLVVSGEPVPENLMRKLSVQSFAPKRSQQKEQISPAKRSPAKSTVTRVSGRPRPVSGLQKVEEEDLRTSRALMARYARGDTENVPPPPSSSGGMGTSLTATRTRTALPQSRSGLPVLSRGPSLTSLAREVVRPSARESQAEARSKEVLADAARARAHALDGTARTLNDAFAAREQGRLWRDPALDARLPGKVVFVQSWVDYTHKYGMGYALTDGTTGVYFNDSSSMVLAPDNEHFDFVMPTTDQRSYSRSSQLVSSYPDSDSGSSNFAKFSASPITSSSNSSSTDLDTKVVLLRAFKNYIYEELYKQQAYTYVDMTKQDGMDFVQKWHRMNNVVMFTLSNGARQVCFPGPDVKRDPDAWSKFNYSDHTKIILSSSGRHVTYVDKDYKLHEYTLAKLMATAVAPPGTKTEKEMRNNDRLIRRLAYCRDVLIKMHTGKLDKEEANLPLATSGNTGTTKTAGLR